MNDLLQALAGVDQPDVANFTQQAVQLKNLLESNSLNSDEYQELMSDLSQTAQIASAAVDLQVQAAINQVLNGLVAIAGAV
jgi:polyhydroxyalkanoate synthesis regulator phasin